MTNTSARFQIWCIALCSVLIGGCATDPVRTVVGDDYWSRDVEKIWAPRTREALKLVEQFAIEQTGERLKLGPPVILTADAEQARKLQQIERLSMVFPVVRTTDPNHQYLLAVRLPVNAHVLALQYQLAGVSTHRVPQWLNFGSAELITILLLENAGSPESFRAWHEQNAHTVRNSKSLLIEPAKLASETSGTEKRETFREMAGLMTAQLYERLGDKYFSAWAKYFRRSGAPDFKLDADFRDAFGVELNQFIKDMEAKLTSIRGGIKEHRRTVPAASNFALLYDTDKFPLSSRVEARHGYGRYLAGRWPKAFALSSRGAWAYEVDDADAMDKALAACRRLDPVSCQLYAVDNTVVYRPVVANDLRIEVSLVSRSESPWLSEVRQRWYPVVEKSAHQFSEYLQKHMGIGLNEAVRLHVAAEEQDFRRVLQQDMSWPVSAVSATGHLYMGIANGQGQVALWLRETRVDTVAESSVIGTLHELVHELQGQLSHRFQSFTPPKWIMEGTADLIAYKVAEEVTLDEAREFTLRQWKNECAYWYKMGQVTATPEVINNANFSAWSELVQSETRPYEMAGLMAIFLESRLGERFFPAWAEYFKLAGTAGQEESKAFQQSFGMTHAEFLEGFKAWLGTL